MSGIWPLRSVIRVPNGPQKTGLDQLVWSKVKSSRMVEIRLTGQSGLLEPTRPGLVRPGQLRRSICDVLPIFIQHITFK